MSDLMERSPRLHGPAGAAPTEHETFFIGSCIRISEAGAILDVRVQRYGTRLRDISQSARSLFPPNGEIELKHFEPGTLEVGDWVAFHVVSQVPRARFRVTQFRRLLPVEDVSSAGTVEAIRRLLVEEGRIEGRRSECMVRIASREMVRVRFDRDADGRWRAKSTSDMARLPVFAFDPKLCIVLSGPEPREFVDPGVSLQQIGTVNWVRDADLVRRVIGSLSRTEEPQDSAIRQFAATLTKVADGLEGGVSGPDYVDPCVARDILRVRNLAALMREQQELLHDYFEALRGDPEIKSLLETRIEAAAREGAEAERKARHENLEAELAQAAAARRAQHETELQQSMAEQRASMLREVEKQAQNQSAELAVRLAEDERRGREAVDASVAARRAELEGELSDLELRCVTLRDEIARLEQNQHDLKASIEALSAAEITQRQELEASRASNERELNKSIEALRVQRMQDVELQAAIRSAELAAELARRERRDQETLEASFSARRAELAREISELETRREALLGDLASCEQKQRTMETAIGELSRQEASERERLELLRADRELELDRSLQEVAAGKMQDIEEKAAARSAELDAGLRAKEQREREALGRSLGRRRADLLSEVAGLEDRRALLQTEVERLEHQERDDAARFGAIISQLEERQTALQSEVQGLEQKQHELETSIRELASSEAGALATVDGQIKKAVEKIGSAMLHRPQAGLAAQAAAPQVFGNRNEEEIKPPAAAAAEPRTEKVDVPAWLKR
jgi:hypothetical protein